MKKPLPKTVPKSLGFTLVELLVVVTIIAVLSTIGFVVFRDAQTKANDTRRVADIDAIAKVYESNATSDGIYQILDSRKFTSNSIPTPPQGGSYTFVAGPDSAAAQTNTFKVCAVLGSGIASGATCTETVSQSCYCKSSALSATGSVTCGTNTFPIPNCKAATGSPSTIYIACPASTITCTGSNSTNLGSFQYWTGALGGAPAGNIILQGQNSGAPVSVTVNYHN